MKAWRLPRRLFSVPPDAVFRKMIAEPPDERGRLRLRSPRWRSHAEA
jgi:hypothetical protein